MSRVAIIPMTAVPPGASGQVRRQMFFDHCQRMAGANPNVWLPLGVQKRWFDFFKIEHPFTRKYSLNGAL